MLEKKKLSFKLLLLLLLFKRNLINDININRFDVI